MIQADFKDSVDFTQKVSLGVAVRMLFGKKLNYCDQIVLIITVA